MAALTAVTLQTNAAGTATATYTPLTKQDGVSTWVDFAVADVNLRPNLTLSVTQPKAGGAVGRVKGKVSFPFYAADGSTRRVGFVNIEAVLPVDMSEADREVLRNLVRSAIASATMEFAMKRFEDVY